MSLIIILLLAAVAWYLLSGMGNRQRVGGGGSSQNRDFQVTPTRSSESIQNPSTIHQAGITDSNQANSKQNGSQISSNSSQPEDAPQESGQSSVSPITGKAVTAFTATNQSSGSSSKPQSSKPQLSKSQSGNQQVASQQSGAQLQSSTYNQGEEPDTLASMQDQAASSTMNWETPGLVENQTTTGGDASGSLANGEHYDTMTSGLTSGIHHLYDGGQGTYEGTSLGSTTTDGYDFTTDQIGSGLGATTTSDLSETTADTNAYQPQETGFSDATTTDEFGKPEAKVTSIEDKRNKKKS